LKSWAIFSLALLLLIAFEAAAFAADGTLSFDYPVKRLLDKPSAEANVNFEIPIDVRIIGMTPDKNWFKVKIAYDLVFLGRYEYTGWVYAPIENVAASAETID